MNIKHTFALGIALGFGFMLGCAASSALVIPPAHAQTATRYEYLTINHGWDGGRWANEAGREGWRFVGFDRGAMDMIFERELR